MNLLARSLIVVVAALTFACGTQDSSRRSRDRPDAATDDAGKDAEPLDAARDRESGTDAPPTPAFTSLVVERAGSGEGTIESDPGGITCGDDCSGEFPLGATITLTAIPEATSTFAGWEGACQGDVPTCTLDLDDDGGATATARFDLQTFSLSVSLTGEGAGAVTSDEGSISCGSSDGGAACDATYPAFTAVELTAVPDESSEFAGWSGACAGAGSTCTLSVSGNLSADASFRPKRHAVAFNTSGTGSGTVTLTSPPEAACEAGPCEITHGTEITVQAVPAAGSYFIGWSGGGCTGAAPECTLVVQTDETIEAVFSLEQLGVSVTKNGTGRGTVTSLPQGIDCGATCTRAFEFGTSITLTAAAATGSTFAGFSGCDSEAGNTCTVDVRAVRTVTATFTLRRYALTVARGGTGTGSVSSAPAGITCGADCTETYNHGTDVVLTAAPAAGSTATWTGCPSPSGNTCTVDNLAAATTVTATFTLNQYALTVVRNGNGTGSVSSAPAGITCGADCTQSFSHGTNIILTAAPAAGSTVAWTNCPAASGNTCTINGFSAARTVTATFTLNTYALTVVRNGNGTGSVSSAPAGITCGADCTQSYSHGTNIILTAAPAAGSTVAWTNCPAASGNTCTINGFSAARTVTATFTLNTYALTVVRNGNGTGSVSSAPAGITCGADCTQSYSHGTNIILTAAPAAGSTVAWTNCPAASGNTCTINGFSAARTVTATFTLNQYSLTVVTSGNGSVSSTPAGITCGADCSQAFNHGANVILTAVPGTGNSVTWSNCPSAAGNTCTLNGFVAARTVTARFTVNRYTLRAALGGAGGGTVTSTPAGISCGADCSEVYNHGDVIALTATPGRTSTFASWTNCPSASLNVCTVTLTAARTVTARFNGPSALFISSPANGASLFYTGDIGGTLWYADVPVDGTALDPEDGALSGASLVWTTDRTDLQSAVIGTGNTPTVRIFSNSLCGGAAHRITLTATDSDGNVRSVFIDVRLSTIC